MTVEATSTLSVHMPGTSGYREATAVYNPGRWMDEERAAFVDLVRRGIDPDGLFRRGVWPPRQPSVT